MADGRGQEQPKKPTDLQTQIRDKKAEIAARAAVRTGGIGISSADTPPAPSPPTSAPTPDGGTDAPPLPAPPPPRPPRTRPRTPPPPPPPPPQATPVAQGVPPPANTIGSLPVDPLVPALAPKTAFSFNSAAPVQKFPFITPLDLGQLN